MEELLLLTFKVFGEGYKVVLEQHGDRWSASTSDAEGNLPMSAYADSVDDAMGRLAEMLLNERP